MFYEIDYISLTEYFEGIQSNEKRDFFYCSGDTCMQVHPNTNRPKVIENRSILVDLYILQIDSEFCFWCNVEAVHEQNKKNANLTLQ